MSLKPGDPAPAFTLTNQDGEQVSLRDFAGKKLVLYFYPKDMTPGCTREAADFQKQITRIRRKGAEVVGVSKDSEKSHRKFCDKMGLTFPLLSDPDGKMIESYGVWREKMNYGKTFLGIVRTTYVIDEKGKIAAVFPKVKVDGHAEELLEAL